MKPGAFTYQVRRDGGEWFPIGTSRTATGAANTGSHFAFSMVSGHFIHIRDGRMQWGAGTDVAKAHEGMGLGKGDDNWMEIEWRVVGPDGKALDSGWRNGSIPDDYYTRKFAKLDFRGSKSAGRYKGTKKKITK